MNTREKLLLIIRNKGKCKLCIPKSCPICVGCPLAINTNYINQIRFERAIDLYRRMFGEDNLKIDIVAELI